MVASRSLVLLALGVVAALAVGCSQPKAAREIQPRRSVDELYAMAAKYNETVDPYLLGTGDGIGQQTYDIYVEESVMGREPRERVH
ncbi:MAG: hypothetical protein GY715_01960 [Planctomycetes bacterium]|nr:hypothetical protein [Planctomycetota bacterium]